MELSFRNFKEINFADFNNNVTVFCRIYNKNIAIYAPNVTGNICYNKKLLHPKYEEVDDYLVKTFPDFIIDDYAEGLPYCVAGSFARYLLYAYNNNSIDTLVLAGKFIEELYFYKDEKIDNLATVGYLEAIQNVWENNSTNPKEMVRYLGDTSKKWWTKLNRFWDGDITALREDV